VSDINIKIINQLSEEDWANYSKIWDKSNTRNPFISADILKLSYENIRALSIVYIYNENLLIGAIPFTFIGTTLHIAGEAMSDSIQFPFLYSVSITQKYQAIKEALTQINPQNIEFKKLCTANTYLFLVIKAVNELNFKTVFVKSWKNLFVKILRSTAEEKEFRGIFNKSNTRNYSNKFRREHAYKASVVEGFDEERLNNWMDYFFMYHEIRWNPTSTPSIYNSKAQREQLNEKVKRWLKEKSCILFSLDVDDKPTSMAICLKTKDSVIYHQIAYSVNGIYLKYRINKLLIFELSKWMADNNLLVLDFGVGMESYKYEYANKDPHLVRLYGAKSIYSKTYIKGVIDYHYQKSPRLINFLNNKVRVTISKIKLKVSTCKSKLRYILNELRTDKKFISKKIKVITKSDTQHFYKFIPNKIVVKPCNDVTYGTGAVYDIMDFFEKEIVLTTAKRQYYLTTIAENKKKPYCLYNKDKTIACIAWMTSPKDEEIPKKTELRNPQVIIDCFTAKSQRGKGYYSYLLNIISVRQNSDVLIYTNDWNVALQKRISEAGFEKIATRVLRNNDNYEWLSGN